jgi:hypothetical protein
VPEPGFGEAIGKAVEQLSGRYSPSRVLTPRFPEVSAPPSRPSGPADLRGQALRLCENFREASCEAITKAGEPCSSGALASSDRCLAHSSPEVKARYRVGGPQVGSGRPRAPRVGELVAAAAVEHADELIAALRAGLADSRQRVQATGTWLRIAHREAELVQRERERQDDFDSLDRQQLLGIVSRAVARLHVSGRLELLFGEDAIPAVPALEGSATEREQDPQGAGSAPSTALLRP